MSKQVVKNGKLPLSRDIASTNTCYLCGKYLSVAPIFMHDDKYICGRCPSAGSRVLAYEKLAQHMIFPCSYLYCNRTLVWGTVDAHEQECLYKAICCPVFDCKRIYPLKTLQAHFKEYHLDYLYIKELILPEIKLSDISCSQKNIYVLVHNDVSHLVFISKTQNKMQGFIEFACQVGVFSVMKQNFTVKYEASLTFIHDDKSTMIFTKKDQEIQLFNENLHTLDQIDTIAATKFESLHKDEGIIVKLFLNIYDSSLVAPAKNCDISTHTFECPICNETMRPPIYLCARGHSICGDCKHKIMLCPFCQSKFPMDCRNYFLEEIITNGKAERVGAQPNSVLPMGNCYKPPRSHQSWGPRRY